MKNKGYEHFYFCLKWLKFVGEYNLGSEKQLLAIKVSSCINKLGFRGLMEELAMRSDFSEVISLKTGQLFT